MLVSVTRQDGNTLTLSDSAGFQPISQSIRLAICLTECKLPFRGFACIDKSKFVRAIEFASGKIIADVHDYSFRRWTTPALAPCASVDRRPSSIVYCLS